MSEYLGAGALVLLLFGLSAVAVVLQYRYSAAVVGNGAQPPTESAPDSAHDEFEFYLATSLFWY